MGQIPPLILPLWRSPEGRTWQYGKCVFIYSWSQEPQGWSYQAGFSQSLGRTTGAPVWRAVSQHTLSPLCVGPESGNEGRQTRHGTHTSSIRMQHPCSSIWPSAEEGLAGTPGNTQQPLHSKTTLAGGWDWRSCFIHPNCFPPLQKSTLLSTLQKLFNFLLFSTVLQCSHFLWVPSHRNWSAVITSPTSQEWSVGGRCRFI